MNTKLPIAVLSRDPARREAITARLSETGVLRPLAPVEKLEELESLLRRTPALALYLDLNAGPEMILDWMETHAEPRPAILTGGPESPELILRAMRTGARAYFPHHVLDEELDRVAARLRAEAAAAPPAGGCIVAVLGAKGGVGTTTVACETAASLARSEARVALVEGKAYFGDLALHLDVEPNHTMADAAARGDELDMGFLETVATAHAASGIHLVAGPVDPEEAEGIGSTHLEKTCRLLREAFDWVVVDLPRLTDEVSLQALDWADQIILVTTPELASVARARQHLALLAELGVSEDRIQLVVNHARSGELFSTDGMASAGLAPVASIPSDPAFVASVEKGCPHSVRGSRGAIADAMEALCEALRGETAKKDDPKPASGDLLGRARKLLEELRCRLANA
ncbi:MAG: AAA family ATPase [bacterium]|nr:AAA family ATPase [bacterium]